MSDTPKRPAIPKAAPSDDTPEGDRIAKVLSRAGIASRREAERMIESGQVTVNGKTITSAALNVTPSDRITVAGQPVAAPEAARLWLYYKPDGLVTSASDEKGRDTVFDSLPPDLQTIVRQTATEVFAEQRKDNRAKTDSALADLVKAGVVVHKLSPEESAKWFAASKSLFDEFSAKSPETKTMVGKILAAR